MAPKRLFSTTNSPRGDARLDDNEHDESPAPARPARTLVQPSITDFMIVKRRLFIPSPSVAPSSVAPSSVAPPTVAPTERDIEYSDVTPKKPPRARADSHEDSLSAGRHGPRRHLTAKEKKEALKNFALGRTVKEVQATFSWEDEARPSIEALRKLSKSSPTTAKVYEAAVRTGKGHRSRAYRPRGVNVSTFHLTAAKIIEALDGGFTVSKQQVLDDLAFERTKAGHIMPTYTKELWKAFRDVTGVRCFRTKGKRNCVEPIDSVERVAKYWRLLESIGRGGLYTRAYFGDETFVLTQENGFQVLRPCDRLEATNSKQGYTVFLSGYVDFSKDGASSLTLLRPLIIQPGASQDTVAFDPARSIFTGKTPNGWMTPRLYAAFWDRVLNVDEELPPSALFHDGFYAHQHAVLQHPDSFQRVTAYLLPGGCTRHVQIHDIACNAVFKECLCTKYQEFARHSAGAHPLVSFATVCEWVGQVYASTNIKLFSRTASCVQKHLVGVMQHGAAWATKNIRLNVSSRAQAYHVKAQLDAIRDAAPHVADGRVTNAIQQMTRDYELVSDESDSDESDGFESVVSDYDPLDDFKVPITAEEQAANAAVDLWEIPARVGLTDVHWAEREDDPTHEKWAGRRDLHKGALIGEGLMTLFQRSVVADAQRVNIAVFNGYFSQYIRTIGFQDRAQSIAKAFHVNEDTLTVLLPWCEHNHWILMVWHRGKRGHSCELRVYDSFVKYSRSHRIDYDTIADAMLIYVSPLLKAHDDMGVPYKCERNWDLHTAQQESGSNDCALHVMTNIAAVIYGEQNVCMPLRSDLLKNLSPSNDFRTFFLRVSMVPAEMQAPWTPAKKHRPEKKIQAMHPLAPATLTHVTISVNNRNSKGSAVTIISDSTKRHTNQKKPKAKGRAKKKLKNKIATQGKKLKRKR